MFPVDAYVFDFVGTHQKYKELLGCSQSYLAGLRWDNAVKVKGPETAQGSLFPLPHIRVLVIALQGNPLLENSLQNRQYKWEGKFGLTATQDNHFVSYIQSFP